MSLAEVHSDLVDSTVQAVNISIGFERSLQHSRSVSLASGRNSLNAQQLEALNGANGFYDMDDWRPRRASIANGHIAAASAVVDEISRTLPLTDVNGHHIQGNGIVGGGVAGGPGTGGGAGAGSGAGTGGGRLRRGSCGERDHLRLVNAACRHIAAAAAAQAAKSGGSDEDDPPSGSSSKRSSVSGSVGPAGSRPILKRKKRRGGILGFKELAAKAGLSPWHFHRVFRSVTGLTPKAYGEACWNAVLSNPTLGLKTEAEGVPSVPVVAGNGDGRGRKRVPTNLAFNGGGASLDMEQKNTQFVPSNEASPTFIGSSGPDDKSTPSSGVVSRAHSHASLFNRPTGSPMDNQFQFSFHPAHQQQQQQQQQQQPQHRHTFDSGLDPCTPLYQDFHGQMPDTQIMQHGVSHLTPQVPPPGSDVAGGPSHQQPMLNGHININVQQPQLHAPIAHPVVHRHIKSESVSPRGTTAADGSPLLGDGPSLFDHHSPQPLMHAAASGLGVGVSLDGTGGPATRTSPTSAVPLNDISNTSHNNIQQQIPIGHHANLGTGTARAGTSTVTATTIHGGSESPGLGAVFTSSPAANIPMTSSPGVTFAPTANVMNAWPETGTSTGITTPWMPDEDIAISLEQSMVELGVTDLIPPSSMDFMVGSATGHNGAAPGMATGAASITTTSHQLIVDDTMWATQGLVTEEDRSFRREWIDTTTANVN